MSSGSAKPDIKDGDKPKPGGEDGGKGGAAGGDSKDSKDGGDGSGGDGKDKKDEKAEEAAPKQFKKGDYVIQVHIIECRDLKGRDFGATSDPVCVVECMGKKENTKTHKKCLNVVFDEVLYFEFKDCFPNELETSKINISVFDANTIRRNELIGAYQFDLATVYYKPHHEVYKQWAALSDTTNKFEGIQVSSDSLAAAASSPLLVPSPHRSRTFCSARS